VYLYEDQGEWLLTSKKHNVLATFKEKSEAKQWLAGFDEHRGVISTITEKVPTPKSKKTKQPKLKTMSSLSVAAVRFGTVKKAEPQSSYKSGYSLCTTCNGDGGINGGCWKCGGSGWM
jgi:DnaJ-class molecular chaperone